MSLKPFDSLITHQPALISIYRSLLRRAEKLKRSNKSIVLGDDLGDERENSLAQLNPERYLRSIASEIIYTINEEFRNKLDNKHHPNEFASKLIRAIEFLNCLQEVLISEKRPWSSMIKLLEKHREEKFRHQQWRLDCIRNEPKIREDIYKKTPALIVKQIESRKARYQAKTPQNSQDNRRSKVKELKKELKNSYANEQHLLRRYIKAKQQASQLPNPYLLPYTEMVIQQPNNKIAKPELAIPGSTRFSVLASAYDMTYINAIVKPSLEYDINKNFYLNQLDNIVNVKGPFKVQINLTEAAPMSIPYIRMPYPRKDALKKVALDVKNLMRVLRLKTVWESPANDNSLSEPKFDDGSYSVRGSKGWGIEEKIWPRHYYEKLAEGEGLWEYNLDKTKIEAKSRKAKLVKQSDVSDDLEKIKNVYISSWKQYLNSASKELDSEVLRYFNYYRYMKSKKSPLFQEQHDLQVKQNQHYNEQVKRYDTLLQLLRTNKVFKHSEIVNKDKCTNIFDDYMKNNSKKPLKQRHGIPLDERIGMGKKLGDYLQEVGYHYYKLGMVFKKKIKSFTK